MRRGRQRDVALAGEQPRRRVQPDPARAGDVHLGPGVQVGEVGGRARRPVERLDVGGQLDQVAGHEPGGQTHLAQDRDQQPREVAARADAGAQREVRRLHTVLHPQAVAEVGVDPPVELDQEVDRAGARRHREVRTHACDQLAGARPGAVLVDGSQIRLEVIGQRLGIAEPADGQISAQSSMKKSKGLITLRSAMSPTVMVSSAGRIREDQPADEVAERVLLPVDEVVGRLDPQRVGLDRRPRVRRRAQPHDVRENLDRPVKGVAGAVLQRNFDGHNRPSHHASRISRSMRTRSVVSAEWRNRIWPATVPRIARVDDRYGSDVLARDPHSSRKIRSAELPIELGMVVEDAQTGYVGAVVRVEYGRMELEDRRGRHQAVPGRPGISGRRQTGDLDRAASSGTQGRRPGRRRARWR